MGISPFSGTCGDGTWRVKKTCGCCTSVQGADTDDYAFADSVEELMRQHKQGLILHFDVNKTVLLTDSVAMKSIEDGIREGISELVWGRTSKDDTGKIRWETSVGEWSCVPPTGQDLDGLMTYAQYCKEAIKEKDARKKATKTFSLLDGKPEKGQMELYIKKTLDRLHLPVDLDRDHLSSLGLKGSTYVMLPAVFHLAARMQRNNYKFSLLFRSFGTDHEKIQTEWNAFCELKHPVFSKLIEDLGPLDGSIRGLPDRRIKCMHTLYRDADGPLLILNTVTNGPKGATWDSWVKAKPKPTQDTRNGREYAKQLETPIIDGMDSLQEWVKQHLASEATAAIKDDWAWWQFNGERSSSGKLLPLLGGVSSHQVFFDDNIEIDDARIVDCRDAQGKEVPHNESLSSLCFKVNPVEAIHDDSYFFKKLALSANRIRRFRQRDSQ